MSESKGVDERSIERAQQTNLTLQQAKKAQSLLSVQGEREDRTLFLSGMYLSWSRGQLMASLPSRRPRRRVHDARGSLDAERCHAQTSDSCDRFVHSVTLGSFTGFVQSGFRSLSGFIPAVALCR